jgi:DmsE family decaheme c-type cytochrome
VGAAGCVGLDDFEQSQRMTGMFNTTHNRWLASLALIWGLSITAPATLAQEADTKAEKQPAKPAVSLLQRWLPEEKSKAVQDVLAGKASREGVDTCTTCHDEDSEYPVFAIFKTKHGTKADPRAPFAHENAQCESCHGPGNNHARAKKADKKAGNILNFGKKAWTPVKDQNVMCMTCHTTHQRIDWKGSSHEFNDVACASCHTVHRAKDPILDKRQQAKMCFDCHAEKQPKFLQTSRHPVRDGQMACTDCHDVHGEKGVGLTAKGNTRQLCVKCHTEKRGPFLWEHAPAAEDCGNCHDPHGSNHAALLKKRVPQLCQQCHMPAQHPSIAMKDGMRGNILLKTKSCTNCHSGIHGSRHPGGMSLTR